MAHIYSPSFAAFSISAATSLACETYTAWLPGSSIVFDLALLVMKALKVRVDHSVLLRDYGKSSAWLTRRQP